MIPLFAILRLHTRRHRQFGLWLPLFLVWLLLLPLVLVLLPFFVIACLAVRMNPWRIFITAWQVITGLAGALVEIEHGKVRVVVRIM